MSRLPIAVLAALALLAPFAPVHSQDASASPAEAPAAEASAAAPATTPGTVFKDEAGVAIRGTDPVAYFTDGKPMAGDPAISHEWAGAKWLFASEEHKKLFVEDPAKYAPQFGGHCAWGVSKGGLYSIQPDAWKVVDGKLYLNYNVEAQGEWQKEMDMHIERAHKNYPGIKDGKTEE